MERNKSGTGRGSKRMAPHPSEFIVLGSKNSRVEVPDPKRSAVGINKAGSTANNSSLTNDRKKESSSVPIIQPPKKPKLATHLLSQAPRPPVSYTEVWETMAIDCDPADIVPFVLDANDGDDGEKLIGLVCGAIKHLKNFRWKPDNIVCMSLFYLVKIKPSIFTHHCVLHALASLLKRDQSFAFKNKGSPTVCVLATNILMRGFNDKKEWPDIFIKIYIEDALGDRTWVDNEECKGFVDNILTAFNTRTPPKSVLQPELGIITPRDCSSPSTLAEDEDNGSTLIQLIGDKEKLEMPVIPRYAHCMDTVENIVVEVVKEQLNRRQPDAITRNFLRLLCTTCGFVEIRNIAVPKLEMWLHNPKLMRTAQELLSYVCYNCSTHTQRDVEVISQFVKMRLKTKAVTNLYLNGVKEIINLHPENLATILKHTVYNELSNARNPNNMLMLGVMFQNSQETSARILGEICQDLLMNREDYLRSLRTLLREIMRQCRHDVKILILARTLMIPRMEIVQQLSAFEFKERMFASIIDLLCLSMFVAISPQIKEAAVLYQRGDKKEVILLHQFQGLVAMIQNETISWLQSSAQQIFGIQKGDLFHALHKIMFLEAPEQYCKPDNYPSEADRTMYMRLVAETPLYENTLIKLIVIGYSKENNITHSEMLELTDQLVRRAAMSSSEVFPLLRVDNVDIIELIFNLCMYQPPPVVNIPAGYVPPTLAISNLYWKSWIMLLILSAHNPSTIGALAWERYPILRMLMEMCITNHFSYPPPTMSQSEVDEERTKELRIEALEKQQILQFETYLAASSSQTQGQQMCEQKSLLLSQTMLMDPQGMARQPPQLILDQIQALNTTHRLGHLLCRSRKPDFLLDIIQQQQGSSSQSMPWLAGLVQNSEGSLNQLPVQCLCEYLLSSSIGQADKQSRQQQLLAHLQSLLTDPLQDSQHAYEVLEYFLRRLGNPSSSNRTQAITGLKLVLESISREDEHMEVDGEVNAFPNESWLLRKLPSLPHFSAVRLLVAKALRNACQVENNSDLIQAYIAYLAAHALDDDLHELTNLVNEVSQLVVERNTILASLLPQSYNQTPSAKQTLHSFLTIYCNYLNKVRAPRQDDARVTWSENQDLILVEWVTGEECTMHILVVHAMIILLTFDHDEDDPLFNQLLETWFPEFNDPPKAFLVDTSEEALLIPDWLKLRIIRSNIPRLVDAALRDLDAYQLTLFIQSFGIPTRAMTKLLHLLDAAVQIDAAAVTVHVLDKTYMTQLVKILHNRGASGGLIFLQHVQLQAQQPPGENPKTLDRRLEVLPLATMLQKRATAEEGSAKIEVPVLLNQLFIENVTVQQKVEAYRKLQKFLAKNFQKGSADSGRGAIVIAVRHILNMMKSVQVKDFLAALIHMPQYSCTLFRLILLPLKSTTSYHKATDLARKMCLKLISLLGDVNSILLPILRDFVNLKGHRSSRQVDRKSKPEAILEKAELRELERIGRKLLNICMENQKNDVLVDSIVQLLVTDNEQCVVKPRTGLLIDWLASVEPELIGTCPSLQMRLLFGKTNVCVRIDESVLSSHSCRPYLLTLLTHGASWATLHKCVSQLLNECHQGYDPAAVLDFLWALTCNPKLWQGREKYSSKNDMPENILLLTSTQLLVLVMYVIEEAVILCDRQSRKTAISHMESRLDLLICCCSAEDEQTIGVVKYLASEMVKRSDTHGDMSHQFLLQIYMKIPKIITYLSPYQTKKLSSNAHISEWTGSVLDCMSHTLLTALATLPRQKSWSSKSRELELCVRKMAAVHPLLVLRQLPLLATSLMGCNALEFGQFRASHHLNLFTQVLGLLELLQPYLFQEEHQNGLEDTLNNFFRCFRVFSNVDDLTSLLNRFGLLLQAYVTHAEYRALKYLQKHIFLLHDLQAHYLGLDSLRALVSGIPILQDGENHRNRLPPINFRTTNSPPSLIITDVIVKLTKLQGEEVLTALQEIEHLSSRKPSILDPIMDNIAELLISPQGNIRTLSHTLLSRGLKHRPHPHLGVLAAYQRCLDSKRADILASALDRLPDYVLCMQEYALPLMQKVFELGVSSNVNTIPHINKSVTLLNTQKGC